MNIIQIFEKFPTQESCIAHLEAARWGSNPVCTYCKSDKVCRHKEENKSRWQCWNCNKSFSVTVGTIFHHTHVPLQKWFLLIALMMNAKKGLSACQASRDIELRRPTVWSMMHRIRKAMADDGALLSGIVEMDETYIGGKPRKDNDHDGDDAPRGRGTRKTPVVGMVERGGDVKAVKATKHTLKSKDLNELIRKHVNTAMSVLITDEYRGYNKVSNILPHYAINHGQTYASGAVHTNTIESFWAIVKRGVIGQYHRVSAKYLDMYLDEFCYRYNARNVDGGVLFGNVIKGMVRV